MIDTDATLLGELGNLSDEDVRDLADFLRVSGTGTNGPDVSEEILDAIDLKSRLSGERAN